MKTPHGIRSRIVDDAWGLSLNDGYYHYLPSVDPSTWTDEEKLVAGVVALSRRRGDLFDLARAEAFRMLEKFRRLRAEARQPPISKEEKKQRQREYQKKKREKESLRKQLLLEAKQQEEARRAEELREEVRRRRRVDLKPVDGAVHHRNRRNLSDLPDIT